MSDKEQQMKPDCGASVSTAELERLAVECGLEPIMGVLRDGDDMPINCDVLSGLEKFASLIAEAERETCAKACEALTVFVRSTRKGTT